MFDAVTAELPAGLPRGQVIARGVAIFDSNFDPLKPLMFAVVGGQRRWGRAKKTKDRYAQDLVVTARDLGAAGEAAAHFLDQSAVGGGRGKP